MSKSSLDPLLGALAADALAMPGHWYYDRLALRRDYGRLDAYVAPRNPHADSILWRSSYTPPNDAATSCASRRSIGAGAACIITNSSPRAKTR